MPVGGRKPSEDRSKVLNKNALAFDWIDILDVPFGGSVPVSLPAIRIITTPKGEDLVPLLDETRQWWSTICRMPHCTLWAESDWQFALSTALVADLAFRGVTSATSELRQREKVLGTTVDFRRDLRIRYVTEVVDDKPAGPANVVSMDDRRARVNAS